MLRPPRPPVDIQLLATSRLSFILSTDEEQRGAVNGKIAMHYLGIPLFSDRAGFSGGLVVTTYTARTHPLHDPTVMADVRVGRYVRDNNTGEWCIITRNDRDRVTRLQYVRIMHDTRRERICLTCSSDLFETGDIKGSVLFQCHDREWRFCNNCRSSLTRACSCPPAVPYPLLKNLTGLPQAVWRVMSEGAASWQGKVRVTVVNNLPTCDYFDACMDVVSSYNPSIDHLLATQMKQLAIMERGSASTCVPAPIANVEEDYKACEQLQLQRNQKPSQSSFSRPLQLHAPSQQPSIYVDHDSVSSQSPMFLPSPPKLSPQVTTLGSPESAPLARPLNQSPLHGSPATFSFFEPDHLEVADHFLIPPHVRISEPLMEQPMLPADPSTLPAGIESCLHGMDFDDDWCSYIASDQDARSVSSTLSNAGSDVAPLPDSVPCVEDAIEMIESEHDFPMPPNMAKRKQEHHPTIIKKPRPLAPQPSVRTKPLAPRPAGMSVTDGFIWQIGAFAGNEAILAARLEAIEKERKAEERRKKNRQAAARSNARKKDIMDGIRAEIRDQRKKEAQLKEKEAQLKGENELLRKRMTVMQ
ncbi:unnamed protein product [Agarophyton chilense]